MKTDDYVHLHVHSDNSILDGMGTIPEYVNRASELGQRGIGLSDHGDVYGLYGLLQESKKAGISAVPGCEFYVAPENSEGAKHIGPIFYGRGEKGAGSADVSGRGSYLHLTVWAINNTGLHNLFKLSTLSWQKEHYYSKPRIDFNMLAEHSEGLVVATGCPSSEISTRFRLGQDDKAYEYAQRLKEVFGDRLYVEIMEHGMKSDLERNLLGKQLELAKKLDLELLATNDAHYGHKHDSPHHEEMLAAQSQSYMSEPPFSEGGKRFAFEGDQYYLKSFEEMNELFPDRDFPRALSNTIGIAEMAQDISFEYDPTLKPKPVLEDGVDEVSYFKKLIEEGFKKRYGHLSKDIQKEAKKCIQDEFHVFHSSDYVGYMLTVHEYTNWTQNNYSTVDSTGVRLALPTGPCRGSAGGSVVSYCLGITELDPLRHNLIFERFLSPGRGSVYEVVYEDGTTEQFIASDEVTVKSGDDTKIHYAHKLEPGDTVLVENED